MIDTYAIVSIFVLIILCAYHSLIGALIFINGEYNGLNPDSNWTIIDRRVFFVLAGLYIVVHLAMGIWHYYVPIAQRRHMHELDKRHRAIIDEHASKDKLSQRSSLNCTTADELIV